MTYHKLWNIQILFPCLFLSVKIKLLLTLLIRKADTFFFRNVKNENLIKI